MKRVAAQQGFTLIEVLVALTLMALVSLISWRGLDAVQRTGDRLDERSEEALALVRALGQIERDLLLHAGADVLPQPASAADGAMAGDNPDTVARMPTGIVWNPQSGLSLVRSAGDGLWQRLHWYLHEGNLMRAAGAPSYLLPLPDVNTGVVVLDQIDALRIRLWVPGQGWIEPQRDAEDGNQAAPGANAPSGAAGRGAAATGLEVSLYKRGLGADQPYRKVVVLP
ncbi:type II secretion system protein J [Pusillimonas sp.]|uniref:type II secretion system protein J n=1 Tax=Pusillimonas sp. TaxID=3040095 RepID=UPI0037C8461D